MNRVKQIYKEIYKLNKELETIRKKCPHDKYRLGMHSWRPGSSILKRICVDCDAILGYPSEEEVKQFNSEKNDGQGKKIYENKHDVVENPFQIKTK